MLYQAHICFVASLSLEQVSRLKYLRLGVRSVSSVPRESARGASCVRCHSSKLHELLPSALGTQNLRTVGDEALAHQRVVAHSANEAVVVPVAVFERDEACSADAGDGLGTGGAPLGEELAEALGAVWLLVPRSESLAR